MISLHEQWSFMRERDDGDQFQRGAFSPRGHSHGHPMVFSVPGLEEEEKGLSVAEQFYALAS